MSSILCILDGFGISPKSPNNAVELAKMSNFRSLLKKYPWTTLNADGVFVGQEKGLVGNSEVGHMNLGGLKLVPQLSFQITNSAINAFDLNSEIAPDQNFDPKEFLRYDWDSGSISELINSPLERNNHNPDSSLDLENSPLQRGVSEADGVFLSSSSRLSFYKSLPFNPELKEKAKKLRKSGNLSEVILWNLLKKKQLLNLNFQRQKIVGNYIVDFYCPDLSLVIEIDGESHDFKGEYDVSRENYLTDLGLKLLHIESQRLKKDLESVKTELYEFCSNQINTPSDFVRHPSIEGNVLNLTDLSDSKNSTVGKNLVIDDFSSKQVGVMESSKTIHLIGLFSTGTIHSDLRHWIGSIESAGLAGADKIILHIISDGRDSDRQSLVATWEDFTEKYADRLKPFENRIYLGSLGGRFYPMDRDNNWDRVARGIMPMFNYKAFDKEDQGYYLAFKKYILSKYGVDLKKILEDAEKDLEKDNIPFKIKEEYDEIVKNGHHNFTYNEEQHFFFLNDDYVERKAEGSLKTDIKWMLQNYSQMHYFKKIYDEFILPCSWYYLPLDSNSRPFDGISNGDTVWLLNYRTDRMKQFVKMLVDINTEFDLDLTILGMNDYGDGNVLTWNELEIKNNGYYPVFASKPVVETFSEAIEQLGKNQLHLAETEKYNHVTYFFNGGQNKKSVGEDWMVIPSNKVTSHSEKPEMKAKEITDYLLESLNKYNTIVVNYANPDMVGHTGDLEASIESLEFLDVQLGRLIEAVEKGDHTLIITADHGNIELVGEYEHNGKILIDTEHNPNPVPLIVVKKDLNTDTLIDNLSKTLKNLGSNISASELKEQLELTKKQIGTNDIDNWELPDHIYKPTLPLHLAGIIVYSILSN